MRRARANVPRPIAAQAGIALGFGAFVLLRALRLSLTYDEAATYIRYIAPHTFSEFDNGPLAVFNFEVATNHFLSTIVTKLAMLLAGPSEIVLRAPALIGYAIYLWFSARILRRLTGGAVAVLGFLLLNLNPYVLDFFALSRGYGLSIGLLIGALDSLFGGNPARTLLFGAAAVLANFSTLNVFVGLVLLCLAPRTSYESPNVSPRHWSRVVAFFAAAAAFSAAVFSQDPGLSPSLYEPVAVRLDGLNSAQVQTARIWRIDLHGRATPFTSANVPFRTIRIEVPADAAQALERVEVIIGNRAFTSDPRTTGTWTSRDVGTTRQFESTDMLSAPRSAVRQFHAVINWAGDREYAICVARASLVAVGVLALLSLALGVAGQYAGRWTLVNHDTWSTASASMLCVAAFAGPPIYLLRRDAQLYFGGTRGIVQDTFFSVIEGSFYGRTYMSGQTTAVFTLIVLSLAAFAAVALIVVRHNRSESMASAGAVLALIVIATASVALQRALFGTVYLIGRTALFFVPLYLLFLVLFCQMLTSVGRAGRVAGTTMLAVITAASALHFARTVNMKSTFDWRDDADTKRMMVDLEHIIADGRITHQPSVLGTEWMYAPVAVYYARRQQPIDVDVAVAPYSRPLDFIYVAARHAGSASHVIKTYSTAGTVLARP